MNDIQWTAYTHQVPWLLLSPSWVAIAIPIPAILLFIQVENASSLLEEASHLARDDPFSKLARTKLIEGSRWDITFLAVQLLYDMSFTHPLSLSVRQGCNFFLVMLLTQQYVNVHKCLEHNIIIFVFFCRLIQFWAWMSSF